MLVDSTLESHKRITIRTQKTRIHAGTHLLAKHTTRAASSSLPLDCPRSESLDELLGHDQIEEQEWQ